METGGAATVRSGKAPAALCVARSSQTGEVRDLDATSGAPPLRPRVGVPFLWEEAPGKPKVVRGSQDVDGSGGAPPSAGPAAAARIAASDVCAAAHAGAGDGGGDRGDGGDRACPVAPLKLPPRLQAAAAAATAECSLSPETVLHGPYASCRKKPGAGVTLTLWKKATAAARGKNHGRAHDAAALDASCRSPSSSSSSSSPSLMSYPGDDHVREAHRRQTDDHEEEDGKNTVRITRFRRNSSLPTLSTSHLWASIRRSVMKITPRS
ncbi:hypothetical protein GUJ93_ZPchr0001g29601 [Zizania palustris]|uniref:Uncharacterized protein n=1 Tax=Zizania palustris TaxID=103762 RepID=A0A8J5UZK3_ZIZPA|nr:hypothetical protein GUJ93_ZPchr0001g29601 [Zizania palustris]